MSIFRLLPLAASAEALRLEVQMQSGMPDTARAKVLASVKGSTLHAPTQKTASVNQEFLYGVSTEVVDCYRASQKLFIETLTKQMLCEQSWIRDACIKDLEKSKESYGVKFADAVNDAAAAVGAEAEDAANRLLALSTAKMIATFSAGFPTGSDFCLCNGLQPIYKMGDGRFDITKHEMLLRCFWFDPNTGKWRTSLATVWGPGMFALQKLGFVDAMYLYCLNLHDACILAAGSDVAQEALSCATINLSVNMLIEDNNGFFCHLAHEHGFNFLEITEKNPSLKKSQLLELRTMPAIRGVCYLLDDYESPDAKGAARHPGQKLLEAGIPVGLKSSTGMTNLFAAALAKETTRSALISYMRKGDEDSGAQLHFDVRGFIDAVRRDNVPELVIEGALNAITGRGILTCRSDLVSAWAETINAVKSLGKTACQQGGNIPEVRSADEMPHPDKGVDGQDIQLTPEQTAWNNEMTAAQRKADIIHNGAPPGAQAELSVFYGVSTGEARYSPNADAIMEAVLYNGSEEGRAAAAAEIVAQAIVYAKEKK